MEKCCSSPYSFCFKNAGCFVNLYLRIPSTYEGQYITTTIRKGSIFSPTAITISLEVIDGWAKIETAAVPQAFFNSYGGIYTFTYTDGISPEPIEFIARDGKIYHSYSAEFEINNQTYEYTYLNPIDETYPNP